MPQYICKLPIDNDLPPLYILWSTVVDAPVTYGMVRSELDDYMRSEHGSRYMEEQHALRMARVEKSGTSAMLGSGRFEDLIVGNHAGKDGQEMTLEEIIAEHAYPPEEKT